MIESPELNSHICGQLIFDKVAKTRMQKNRFGPPIIYKN